MLSAASNRVGALHCRRWLRYVGVVAEGPEGLRKTLSIPLASYNTV